MPTPTIPTVFIVFGATGDLMEKKLAPALFKLYKDERLPKLFQILGVSRQALDDAGFKSHVQKILLSAPDYKKEEEKEINTFVNLLHYISGEFADKSLYTNIGNLLGNIDKSWNACSNKLFYLAVPPVNYETLIKGLTESGLNTPCSDQTGYTRVIVEKPFGRDLDSSNALNALLSGSFKEEQIYRLDHYLGKRMIQNLLAFRFSNSIFEGIWNNKYIEKVEIKLLETLDTKGRGVFYDEVGALRDVGQNHLLEFLSNIAMESPGALSASSIRTARANILETVETPDINNINFVSYRAQYDGYLAEEGIEKNSNTETYFKIALSIAHPNWRGVPFILESGKALKERKKEIVITFKKPQTEFAKAKKSLDESNKMLFKLEPTESIQFDLWSKKEGYEMVVEDKRFLLNERDAKIHVEYTEEYEKLLIDAFLGDQTFFVAQSEVIQMWRIVDPIVSGWKKNSVPLNHYPKGTDTIRNLSKEWIEIQNKTHELKSEVGIVGLGKMGGNLARNFLRNNYKVVGFNRSREDTDSLSKEGLTGAYSLEELVKKLEAPRIIWLSLPHGDPTHTTIEQLSNLCSTGDTVLDAGNSNYHDAQKHHAILSKKGIEFMDVGISGGPFAALHGACLIVGGSKKLYDHLHPMFIGIGYPGGVAHFEGVGAGHFVKMVHNGIEYGMMQALAEGMTILKASEFNINLPKAAEIYAHGSVIEGRLVGWLSDAFREYGPSLGEVKGSVDATGEGEWTLEEAEKKGLPDWVLKASVDFRKETQESPSFTGQVLSAIRGQFGGHDVK